MKICSVRSSALTLLILAVAALALEDEPKLRMPPKSPKPKTGEVRGVLRDAVGSGRPNRIVELSVRLAFVRAKTNELNISNNEDPPNLHNTPQKATILHKTLLRARG